MTSSDLALDMSVRICYTGAMTAASSVQVKRFQLSIKYQASILMEIAEDFEANAFEEETITFGESVRSFYGNLMDDLHDSHGDAEYQEGVLERMQFIEDQLGQHLNEDQQPFSAEDKLGEAEWAKA